MHPGCKNRHRGSLHTEALYGGFPFPHVYRGKFPFPGSREVTLPSWACPVLSGCAPWLLCKPPVSPFPSISSVWSKNLESQSFRLEFWWRWIGLSHLCRSSCWGLNRFFARHYWCKCWWSQIFFMLLKIKLLNNNL